MAASSEAWWWILKECSPCLLLDAGWGFLSASPARARARSGFRTLGFCRRRRAHQFNSKQERKGGSIDAGAPALLGLPSVTGAFGRRGRSPTCPIPPISPVGGPRVRRSLWGGQRGTDDCRFGLRWPQRRRLRRGVGGFFGEEVGCFPLTCLAPAHLGEDKLSQYPPQCRWAVHSSQIP